MRACINIPFAILREQIMKKKEFGPLCKAW